jgi:hypothetical protein
LEDRTVESKLRIGHAGGNTVLSPTVLNTVGLVTGMVGVALIFRWGPPQPTFEEGIGLGLEDGTPLSDGRTVAQHNAAIRALRARHDTISKSGLVMVFVGFAFQLWATWA